MKCAKCHKHMLFRNRSASGFWRMLRRVPCGFGVCVGGSTFGQWAAPQIEAAYETGEMPQLLSCLMSGGDQ